MWGEGTQSAEFSPEISPCSEVSLSILSPGQKDLRGNLRCPPRGMLSIPAHYMASVCGRRPSLAAGSRNMLAEALPEHTASESQEGVLFGISDDADIMYD